MPSKFRSRVKLAALTRVNPGSMYNPSRERWLCSCVTFTCAFVGTIAPNKPAATRETESESFNAAHWRFRHRQREVKLFIRISKTFAWHFFSKQSNARMNFYQMTFWLCCVEAAVSSRRSAFACEDTRWNVSFLTADQRAGSLNAWAVVGLAEFAGDTPAATDFFILPAKPKHFARSITGV